MGEVAHQPPPGTTSHTPSGPSWRDVNGNARRRAGGLVKCRMILSSVVALFFAALSLGNASAAASTDTTPSRVVARDGTGDGWFYENDGPSSVKADPTPKTIDVTRVVVRHRPHAVVVKLRVVNLRKVGTQETNLSLRTPRPGLGEVSIEGRSGAGNRVGRLRIESEFGDVICSRATIVWAYAKDLSKIRMPRGPQCLDRPAWVRAAGSTSVWFDDSGALFVDDALSARPYSGTYTPRAYKPSL